MKNNKKILLHIFLVIVSIFVVGCGNNVDFSEDSDKSKDLKKTGGYCAGNGSGKEHERFYAVRKALKDAIDN